MLKYARVLESTALYKMCHERSIGRNEERRENVTGESWRNFKKRPKRYKRSPLLFPRARKIARTGRKAAVNDAIAGPSLKLLT